MKKIFTIILAVVFAAAVFVGCTSDQEPTQTQDNTNQEPKDNTANNDNNAEEKTGPIEVATIIKATDSDYWQYVLLGSTNAMKDNPDQINVTTYGPPSEADIDKQVSILENVIAQKPDAIVIASTSSDATVPALEGAYAQGITIVTVDNKVNTDKVHSFLATDNLKGGGLAAERMVEEWESRGIDPSGKKVVVISAMAGVQVLTDRDTGFTEKMKELVPDIEFVETRYTDNDIVKALGAAEDLLTANDDLIGIFADNNHTGDGVARAIAERGAEESVMCIAYDSDPEEVSALEAGAIKALVLQDPYGMGYKGTMYALDHVNGKEIPEKVDTGATVVTKDNMNDPDIAKLLDPMLNKKD